MAHCFLVGFMGCGKTTIGEEIAKTKHIPFIDSDHYVENVNGKTIKDIFADYGEEEFRNLEHTAIKELANKEGVVSLGGGAYIQERNRNFLKDKAPIVFLDCDFDKIYNRIKDTNRPLVLANTKEELHELYKNRLPIYLDGTCKVNTTDKTIEEIVMEIDEIIEKYK